MKAIFNKYLKKVFIINTAELQITANSINLKMLTINYRVKYFAGSCDCIKDSDGSQLIKKTWINNLSGSVLSLSSLLLMFTVTYIIAVIKIVTVTHVTVTHIISHIITVYGSAQSLSIREYSSDKWKLWCWWQQDEIV